MCGGESCVMELAGKSVCEQGGAVLEKRIAGGSWGGIDN